MYVKGTNLNPAIAVLVLACSIVLTFAANIPAQELVITGFPLSTGGSVDSSLFEPFYSELQAMADTLQKYPMVIAVITGSADGIPYAQNNDSQNPGLALGRAHVLANLLVDKFKVDKNQIVIQSRDTKNEGEQYRYADIRLVRDLADMQAQIDSLARRPPVIEKLTEVKDVSNVFYENTGLYVGAGFSSTPFGGMPILTGGVTYKRTIFIEGVFGHTFWRNSFVYEGADLSTIRRMVGGAIFYYPLSNLPVGLAGGWIRTEELSRRYNEYVKMSEGPVLGIRLTAMELISFTGYYNPAKHNIVGKPKSEVKNNQFLFSLDLHFIFGGRK